tara:strand:+ start:834 stop:1310 length:477 start_codon:yes stop_codon:yes gene_type:complete
MKKTAIFPGSFSPFTFGHLSIIERMLPLFDKIIVAIGVNSTKNSSYPIEKNIIWIKNILKNHEKIEVISYNGLTVEICEKLNASYIIRGVRDEKDFDFEKKVAQNNKELNTNIETLLVTTLPKYSHISSSIVRDIVKNNGDISKLIPNSKDLKSFFKI